LARAAAVSVEMEIPLVIAAAIAENAAHNRVLVHVEN